MSDSQVSNREIDWFLEFFVSIANQGVTLGITLNVHGTLISGNLIGGKEYFELLSKSLVDSGSDMGKALAAAVVQGKDRYDQSIQEEPVNFHYIHLKNAKVFNSNKNPMPTDGMLWRGRLNSVDGFTIGELSVD